MSHELTEATIRDWWNDDDEACSWKALDLGEMIALNRVAHHAYDLGKQAATEDDGFVSCSPEDIQKGDLVERTSTESDGTIIVTTGVAYGRDKYNWWTERGCVLSSPNSSDTHRRKPAPTRLPDPEKHPVILDEDGDVWVAKGGFYFLPGNEIGVGPEDFPDDWSPAKIVPEEAS